MHALRRALKSARDCAGLFGVRPGFLTPRVAAKTPKTHRDTTQGPKALKRERERERGPTGQRLGEGNGVLRQKN